MEAPSKRTKISRIDKRHRPAVEVEQKELSVQDRQSAPLGEEEEWPVGIIDEPLLVRERQGRKVMGNKHLLFHRRQAESTPPVLTVVVDVIATVDSNGNVIGTQTMAPTSDAVATIAVVPTVPAVPPFPSDLKVPTVPSVPAVSMPTVPAFPFPSGVPSVQTVGSVDTPDPTSTAPTAARGSTQTSLTFTTGSFNSTSTSTRSSTSTSSASRSGSTSVTLSSSLSSSRSTSIPPSSSLATLSLSDSSSLASGTWSWDPIASSTVYVVGGGPINTAASPAATTPAANASASEDTTPPITTPQVVGSVIGSLAGAAVLLALLLFLIRRHKRKRGGALQLPGQDAGDSQPIASSGQDMAQRRSLPTSTPFFSRFSVTSRSTADTSTTGERGFQRVSGRKLPSAFSEGMTSEQFEPREGTLSGSSFYRDESGFYGGPGFPPGSSGPAPGSAGAKEKFMPSPARTPVIHHPDDVPPFGGMSTPKGSNFSRPQSPPTGTPRPRGTLGRSHPSFDGSRGSKFTEDV